MVDKVGYHTFDECKCKVAGIKSLLEQICRVSDDDTWNRYVGLVMTTL